MDFKYDNIESICQHIIVNLRVQENEMGKKTLGDYLFSRSVAGMNSSELIANIERASQNVVTGQDFPFHPNRNANLTDWLVRWISKGAVPVALLNLQKTHGVIPDAWHHQMIYRCEQDRVYLTNFLEYKSTSLIVNELNSESVLLVKSSDVIKHFTANAHDLHDLVDYEKISFEEKIKWKNLMF